MSFAQVTKKKSVVDQWCPVPREVSGAVGPPGIADFVTLMVTFWLLPHPQLLHAENHVLCPGLSDAVSESEMPSSHPSPQELVTHRRRGQPPLSLEEPVEEGWALGWGRCLGVLVLGVGGGGVGEWLPPRRQRTGQGGLWAPPCLSLAPSSFPGNLTPAEVASEVGSGIFLVAGAGRRPGPGRSWQAWLGVQTASEHREMPRRRACLRVEPLPKIIQGAAVSDSETGSGCLSGGKPRAPHQLCSGNRWPDEYFFLLPKSAGRRTACLERRCSSPSRCGNRAELPPPLPQPRPHASFLVRLGSRSHSGAHGGLPRRQVCPPGLMGAWTELGQQPPRGLGGRKRDLGMPQKCFSHEEWPSDLGEPTVV